jgi:hypothetical protein
VDWDRGLSQIFDADSGLSRWIDGVSLRRLFTPEFTE